MISPVVALGLGLLPSLVCRANAAAIPSSATAEGLDLSDSLQNILSNSHNSDAYKYPTDLTRGIVPVSQQSYGIKIPF